MEGKEENTDMIFTDLVFRGIVKKRHYSLPLEILSIRMIRDYEFGNRKGNYVLKCKALREVLDSPYIGSEKSTEKIYQEVTATFAAPEK